MRLAQRLQEIFLLILLVIGLSSVAVGGPQTGGWGFGGNPRPDQYIAAFFQAFSSNGRGTTGACSTTAPTGYKGQVLTFTRASAGTCTKTPSGGLAVTGIADGDLVVLTNNVARVEYDQNGTLGLLKQAARTNTALRSQQLDVAPNLVTGDIPGRNAVVTADFATAPDGAMTAQRVQLSATDSSGSQYSAIYQTLLIVPTSVTSIYVKGNGTSGTIDVCSNTVAKQCNACAYVSSSWVRCQTVPGSTLSTTFIGNMSLAAYNGSVARPAQDVLLWQLQSEEGGYATSSIPTTSAAVARATQGVPTWNITDLPVGTGFSAATSLWTYVVPTTGTTLSSPSSSANPPLVGRFSGGNFGCYIRASPGGGDLAAGTWVDGQNRWSCSTGRYSALNATSATAASVVTLDALTDLGIGSSGGFGDGIDGIYSRICLDPDPTRCR